MAHQFKKIAFTCYPVHDMARAREFYEGTLGLTPGENFNGGWQEYDLGGTTLAISTMIVEYVKPGVQGSVAFEVADLPGLVNQLKAKKVPFNMDEIMDTPVCRMAFIKDPDGNSISLHQLK
jgi:catechol 2,3-dioxygenase-like lactoylglutathione lyase family enzyme